MDDNDIVSTEDLKVKCLQSAIVIAVVLVKVIFGWKFVIGMLGDSVYHEFLSP